MNEKTKKDIIDFTRKWIKDIAIPSDFYQREIAKLNFNNKNIVLIGMRRLGKSTFLKYLYQKIEDSKNDNKEVNGAANEDKPQTTTSEEQPINTIVLDLDKNIFSHINFKKRESEFFMNWNDSIHSMIKEYDIQTIFIDEIQRIDNWTIWLKGLVEEYPNIRFIATGSDANTLEQSSEFGGGRFQIIYIGMYMFKEFNATNHLEKGNVDYYMDNYDFPSSVISHDKDLQFSLVIEKQMGESNLSRENIKAVYRNVSLNPGWEVNPNSLQKVIADNGDSKPDNKQVKKILDFLVKSKIIIRLENIYTTNRASKRNLYKYYPSIWNSFTFFTTANNSKEITEDHIIKTGFVFENMIISNVISSFNSLLELTKNGIGYYKCKSGSKVHDFDLAYGNTLAEIKSYDVLAEKNKEKLEEIIEKFKIIPKRYKAIVVHIGQTKKHENIEFINVTKFLKEQLWKQNKK